MISARPMPAAPPGKKPHSASACGDANTHAMYKHRTLTSGVVHLRVTRVTQRMLPWDQQGMRMGCSRKRSKKSQVFGRRDRHHHLQEPSLPPPPLTFSHLSTAPPPPQPPCRCTAVHTADSHQNRCLQSLRPQQHTAEAAAAHSGVHVRLRQCMPPTSSGGWSNHLYASPQPSFSGKRLSCRVSCRCRRRHGCCRGCR